MDSIIAALLDDAFTNNDALGQRDVTPRIIIDHILVNVDKELNNPANIEPMRNLNHYIEAQIYGDISLKEDAEILVADPSFKGTEVGEFLEKISQQYSIELYWHMGYELSVKDVPSDFRGPSMPSLARRIAPGDIINASIIGQAAKDLSIDPISWSDRGTYKEVVQELKLLWHVLVKYGKPNSIT
ncbi:hypothetical protein FHR92_002025 [Fontibacillus solani]|uniref:Uncharacterized protein n=1 Tax=Fontibacillus solani TaxID=1572857 RepID=A0A7W3SSW6_9BACL|nr:hypothetical protein [Fontibacillus solani]